MLLRQLTCNSNSVVINPLSFFSDFALRSLCDYLPGGSCEPQLELSEPEQGACYKCTSCLP